MAEQLDRFLQMVSRSNKLVYGWENLRKTKPQLISLMIAFSTASEKTLGNITEFATTNQLSLIRLNPLDVPNFLQKKNLAVVAILDRNIASKITNLMKEGDTYE